MESTTVQIITTALAVLGAVLGLYNAWRNWVQDRVRLKVSVSHASLSPGGPGFSVAIVNLSNFPLTITHLGFDRIDGSHHMQILSPMFLAGEQLPIRLASRTATTAFVGLRTLQHEQLLAIRRAYVSTACGKRSVSRGTLFDEYRATLAEKR
ncbi:MAG: hypothetical protein U1C04_18760 [Hydrogenophaga sp.]|uniref:hypothetical protein n=1 Tax=Hydrogenophaga sp. TaxID=1904254 RepID=UPI002ABBA2FE|nr:hypothetical protein [Hydrogenophaga sp.]MDZ4282792.1 hypothetical protein [Hydrogenophaga sp.]